jgi:hypothetical protein
MRRRDLLGATLASAVAPAAFAGSGPVVLELFTSQGCSSCPPADALLGRLARKPAVIALAWHVDYWDRLGWRDRFASREATTRQQDYAQQLDNIVFTPALVVNGARIVVGSEYEAVEAAMQAATPLPVQVALTRKSDGVVANVAAGQGRMRALRVAYHPEQATNVGAGENEGARLREYRIVRDVETLGEWDGSARQFAVKPAGSGMGQVILVQAADLRVLGAADLPAA